MSASSPRLPACENGDNYILEIEMLGVSKDGLEISIVGHRSNSAIDGAVVHRESRPHHYRRLCAIDPSIDSGKISVRINQGIVTLALPKAEEVKPRRSPCPTGALKFQNPRKPQAACGFLTF